MRKQSWRWRIPAVGLVGLCALSAWVGSIGMVSGLLPVGTALASRLPFQSPVFGGVALAIVVGGPMTTTAFLVWRGHRRAGDAVTLAGLALTTWIVVEVLVVRQLSVLQPVCGLVGIAMVAIGTRAIKRPVAVAFHPRTPTPPLPGQLDTDVSDIAATAASSVDLYWIPLGAGGHLVRFNGRIYEAILARHQHRQPQELYHAALEVVDQGRPYTIEMAPVWQEKTRDRGVVCEGPVGLRALGRLRAFRYEVRCWPYGSIPDIAYAVDSPHHITDDADTVINLLTTIRMVPALTWGLDELGLGEMWNSNSLIAWLLARVGHGADQIRPPSHGRAPGWKAGLELAARQAGAKAPELVQT